MSMGLVMLEIGVAVTSLIFQNLLRLKLERTVHGPEAAEIIRIARISVRFLRLCRLHIKRQGRLNCAYVRLSHR